VKFQVALKSVAYIIKAANDAGVMSTESATSITYDQISEQLPTADNLTWSDATISESSGVWTYGFELSVGDDASSDSIEVSIAHTPDASNYEGLITYTATLSNGDKDAGSLYYNNSDGTLVLNARNATYQTGSTPTFGTDSDVSSSYELLSPTGFSGNFSIFAASFSLETLVGNYVYAWQAGNGDDKSRVFNVNIASDTDTVATGYFGFGDTIDTTDGSILGMICNWAGPGNSHVPVDYYQKQVMTYNTTTNSYDLTTSNIEFTITTSCTHDGSGSFKIDRDLDGTVDDSVETVTSSDDDFMASGVSTISMTLPEAF
jgi:hypothetical protein